MSHFGNGEISERIGLIGPGRLGSTLALALRHVGRSVGAVSGPTQSAAAALAARLPGAQVLDAATLVTTSNVVVLAVPDAVIAKLGATLPWRSGQRVVHCSGALGLDALDAVRAAGALRGGFHPLQTFPGRFADPARLRGIAIGIEGDAPLDVELEQLCRDFGAMPLPLRGIDRARYHAAAVFASNYVVALHTAAA